MSARRRRTATSSSPATATPVETDPKPSSSSLPVETLVRRDYKSRFQRTKDKLESATSDNALLKEHFLGAALKERKLQEELDWILDAIAECRARKEATSEADRWEMPGVGVVLPPAPSARPTVLLPGEFVNGVVTLAGMAGATAYPDLEPGTAAAANSVGRASEAMSPSATATPGLRATMAGTKRARDDARSPSVRETGQAAPRKSSHPRTGEDEGDGGDEEEEPLMRASSAAAPSKRVRTE